MKPWFNVFGRTIPAYSLFGVIGFLLGLSFVLFSGHRLYPTDRKAREDAVYIYTFGALGALIGSKVLYLIVHFGEVIQLFELYKDDLPLFFSSVLSAGLVFYGGLFGGLAGAFYTMRQYGTEYKKAAPLLVPTIPIFAGFGRVGCFFTGCCYGRETTSRFGVVFRASEIAPHDARLIPTQLLEADFQLLMFFVILILIKKGVERVLEIYLISYACFRFVLEFFRGDVYRGYWLRLSTSQWISIGLIIAVVFIYGRDRKRVVING